MFVLQAGSYACMWAVQRIALRTERWGPVITSQLASNAFGRVVPGGVAASGAMQYAMLVRAGVPAAPRRLRHDRVVGAGVRHAVRAARCWPCPRCSAGRRWTRDWRRRPPIGAVVFVLMFALGAACLASTGR